MSAANTDDYPWVIRLAAREFGLRERHDPMTPEIQVRTEKELRERGYEWQTPTLRPTRPAVRNSQPPQIKARREKIRSEIYDLFLESDVPVLCKYDPGIGKTVTTGIAAADRDRRHALLFLTHQKARDFLTEEKIEDEAYLHLKGQSQPRHDCCLEAGDDPCDTHGSQKKLMCPVYERDADDPIRQKFEVRATLATHEYAHMMVPEVDPNCPWRDQFDRIGESSRIVGVHEYQTYFDSDRDVIIDEAPRFNKDNATWTTADLHKTAELLSELDHEIASPIADWVNNELKDALDEGTLSVCPQPKIQFRSDPAEILAEIKIEYNEALESRTSGDWDGTQPCFNALLAAIGETGIEPLACKEAIFGPDSLFHCPRCRAVLTGEKCESDNCGWVRAEDTILAPGRRSRVRVEVHVNDDNELDYTSMGGLEEIPKDVLILDATGTVDKIAAGYGVSPEDVTVVGDEPIDCNAHVVQINAGQYHAGTIRRAVEDETNLARRIQRSIDMVGQQHESPLFVIKKRLEPNFEFPENGIVAYWGALRGLNSMKHCDAVMCIGALHPRIDALRREARLLASDHPDISVGGLERSNREESPYPPVERDIIRSDSEKCGWRVQTKAFTGLVGALFKEIREKEMVQAVHRPRPILSDETVQIYILSNVPTELPVDEFLSWEEFIDPPVPKNAIDYLVNPLVERYDEEMIKLSTADARELVGEEFHKDTVKGWMNELADDIESGKYNENIYVVNMEDIQSYAYPRSM